MKLADYAWPLLPAAVVVVFVSVYDGSSELLIAIGLILVSSVVVRLILAKLGKA
jgi:hypothetical protein